MEPGCFCCRELVDATFPSRWSPALLLAWHGTGTQQVQLASVHGVMMG